MNFKKIKKLLRLLGNSRYRSCLFKGVAAGVEHEILLWKLDCKTVVDIGSNKGQFALAARRCFPEAKIISFEPLPLPAGAFQKVFANDSCVTLYRFAISDTSGESNIHISHREDSSSLLPITELQNNLFPGTYEIGVEKITTKRLDEILNVKDIAGPALLKIDVQGFELNVLKGCELLLSSFKYVYVECSNVELYRGQALASDIISFLESWNFTLKDKYNTSYDAKGSEIQSDFLFANSAF